MRKITLLLTLLVSYAGFAQFPLPYCTPGFTNNIEPITLVNFAGINNSSPNLPVGLANGTTIIAIEDYTAITGNVTAGATYPITLKGNTDGASFTVYFRVYVDWNHNDVFTDPGESYDIGTITNSTGIDAKELVGSIEVPPTALPGNTRIRVMKKFNAYPTGPCQTGAGFGQVEDYTLIVAPLPTDLPDYVNLQHPFSATIPFGGSVTVYGRVYEPGLTDTTTGQAPGIQAWVGVSPVGSNTNPNTWTNWIPATFNVETNGNNNDEYQANIGPNLTSSGTFYYATRFKLNGGGYVYGGINDGIWDATTHPSGVLTVSPPANDECTGATALTVNGDTACGTVTPGSTSGATASSASATVCGGTPDDDVWYSFVASAPVHRIVLSGVTGSVTDLYHSVWSGDCATGLTLVPGSCSDADTSNPNNLSIGTTYYIRVYTTTATAGQTTSFNICVGTPPPPPANDECTGAVGLTVNTDLLCGTVTPGTVLNATGSATPIGACFGTADDDVWYSFVATNTTHRISILNAAGSVTDMYHSLWTGNCAGLTLVTGSCSDPNTSNPAGLVVGQTYYVRVYTYTATGGQNTTFNICIGTPPPPPPPPVNNECAGATGLTVNTDLLCGTVTAGTVLGATASSTPIGTCFGTADDDVWYSFVATATSHRISLLNVAGSVTDMYHSLWTGDCAALTLVTGSCSDADTSNPTGLVVGQTYYVRVYTYTGTAGQTTTFNICIGTPPPPPPPPANDACANATVVACASTTTGTTANATNENMAVCGISGVTAQNTPGVWYKYVGDGSEVTATTCSTTITTGDSRIAVYTGACGTMTCIAGNDDAQTAGCASNTLSSVVTFTTVTGTDYYILVYSYTLTPGTNPINFELSVNCVAPCTPATGNDDCATATAITVGTPIVGANNSCASPSLGVTYPTCANQFGTYYDTWYSFQTGTAAADYTIALSNATGTNGYALYSGTCGTLAMVTGSCATAAGSTVVTGLTTNTTYYVRVFSTATASRGSFDLSVSSTLGSGSFDSSSFSYYPNPVKNTLNLSYNQEISNVEVFNLLGQKVLSNKMSTTTAEVDMSRLSKGAYIVKVTSNNQVKTIKVIKE